MTWQSPSSHNIYTATQTDTFVSVIQEMSESSVAAVNQRNSYILFYKRQGYNFDCLMPDVSSKSRDDKGIDDEFNSELSKAASCCIQ